MSKSCVEEFKKLAEAIKSLEIFPKVIKEFKTFLYEQYRSYEPSEPTWVHGICLSYGDNCRLYAENIQRVVVTQFLAKFSQAASDEERESLIKVLKADINSAHRQLNSFLGETTQTDIKRKLETDLAKMETIQKEKDETAERANEFFKWLKEEIINQTGAKGAAAKFLGELWKELIENVSEALKSDFDHEGLKQAVVKLEVNLPKMEESLDWNRRALGGVDGVLDDFMKMVDKGEHDELSRDINNACDHIIETTKNITDD